MLYPKKHRLCRGANNLEKKCQRFKSREISLKIFVIFEIFFKMIIGIFGIFSRFFFMIFLTFLRLLGLFLRFLRFFLGFLKISLKNVTKIFFELFAPRT